MFKLVLEKAEEPEIKLPISTGSSKKQENYRKTSISALLTIKSIKLSTIKSHIKSLYKAYKVTKSLTVWITINCGKF